MLLSINKEYFTEIEVRDMDRNRVHQYETINLLDEDDYSDIADLQTIDAEIIDYGVPEEDFEDTASLELPHVTGQLSVNTSNIITSVTEKNAIVKVVDCDKYPWYYRKYMPLIISRMPTPVLFNNDIVTVNSDEDSDDEIHHNLLQIRDNNDHLTNKDTQNVNVDSDISEDKVANKEYKKSRKENLEILQAVNQRKYSEIDLQKNKGLVGMQIKYKMGNCSGNVKKESNKDNVKKLGQNNKLLEKKALDNVNINEKQTIGAPSHANGTKTNNDIIKLKARDGEIKKKVLSKKPSQAKHRKNQLIGMSTTKKISKNNSVDKKIHTVAKSTDIVSRGRQTKEVINSTSNNNKSPDRNATVIENMQSSLGNKTNSISNNRNSTTHKSVSKYDTQDHISSKQQDQSEIDKNTHKKNLNINKIVSLLNNKKDLASLLENKYKFDFEYTKEIRNKNASDVIKDCSKFEPIMKQNGKSIESSKSPSALGVSNVNNKLTERNRSYEVASNLKSKYVTLTHTINPKGHNPIHYQTKHYIISDKNKMMSKISNSLKPKMNRIPKLKICDVLNPKPRDSETICASQNLKAGISLALEKSVTSNSNNRIVSVPKKNIVAYDTLNSALQPIANTTARVVPNLTADHRTVNLAANTTPTNHITPIDGMPNLAHKATQNFRSQRTMYGAKTTAHLEARFAPSLIPNTRMTSAASASLGANYSCNIVAHSMPTLTDDGTHNFASNTTLNTAGLSSASYDDNAMRNLSVHPIPTSADYGIPNFKVNTTLDSAVRVRAPLTASNETPNAAGAALNSASTVKNIEIITPPNKQKETIMPIRVYSKTKESVYSGAENLSNNIDNNTRFNLIGKQIAQQEELRTIIISSTQQAQPACSAVQQNHIQTRITDRAQNYAGITGSFDSNMTFDNQLQSNCNQLLQNVQFTPMTAKLPSSRVVKNVPMAPVYTYNNTDCRENIQRPPIIRPPLPTSTQSTQPHLPHNMQPYLKVSVWPPHAIQHHQNYPYSALNNQVPSNTPMPNNINAIPNSDQGNLTQNHAPVFDGWNLVNMSSLPPGISDIRPQNMNFQSYSMYPPPPPPPPPQPVDNRNIFPGTVNCSIIGRNNEGDVKKINLTQSNSATAKVEVKMEHPEVERSCPSIQAEDEAPILSKQEMMKELERATKVDYPQLKRPTQFQDQSKKKKYKPGPLSKKKYMSTPPRIESNAQPGTGYSPPVLPIPTYDTFLTNVSSIAPSTLQKPPTVPQNPVKNVPPKNNPNPAQYKSDVAKKITLKDYQKRALIKSKTDDVLHGNKDRHLV